MTEALHRVLVTAVAAAVITSAMEELRSSLTALYRCAEDGGEESQCDVAAPLPDRKA